MPLVQKSIAFLFVLLFIASFIFIGYRIYTKPAYEAHEKEQARALALSTVMLFAEKTSIEPAIWEKFSENNIELMIDHMKIKGNWSVKIFISKKNRYVEFTCSVNSGWNSRSPQSAEFRAEVHDDGKMVFKDTSPSGIPEGKSEALGKLHVFRFADEMKKVPVRISAEEYLLTDAEGRDYLLLKLPSDNNQDLTLSK